MPQSLDFSNIINQSEDLVLFNYLVALDYEHFKMINQAVIELTLVSTADSPGNASST